MIKPRSIVDAGRKLQIMAGLMSVLTRSPELASAINAAIVEPRAEVNRILLRRAIDRGEIAADIDVDAIALIAPSMAAYRTLVQQQPVDREFLLSIIDGVVLPAVGVAASSAVTAPEGAGQRAAEPTGTTGV